MQDRLQSADDAMDTDNQMDHEAGESSSSASDLLNASLETPSHVASTRNSHKLSKPKTKKVVNVKKLKSKRNH